jgi:hypothetical protein
MGPRFLSLAKAAEHLDLTPGALQKRMERGLIPDWTWKRIGRRTYRFDTLALDEWMTEDQAARRGRRPKFRAVA